jgi:hypothetical protein
MDDSNRAKTGIPPNNRRFSRILQLPDPWQQRSESSNEEIEHGI